MAAPRKDSSSNWQGRKPKGEKDSHSFKTFVAKAKSTAEGKAHLQRHHGGHGL